MGGSELISQKGIMAKNTVKTINKRAARLLALVAVVAAAVLLTGCGASLTVYDYTSGGVRYNAYELTIDGKVADAMDATAAYDADGRRYDVPSYFLALFASFGYEPEWARRTDEAYSARFVKAFYDGKTDLERAGGRTLDFVYEFADDPFLRTVTAKAQNPFNGVRAAFDAIPPDQTATVLQQLKNGSFAFDEFGDRITILPSVTDAFPFARGSSLDGLRLNYVRAQSSRMKSSGTATRIDGDNSEYMFSRYFDKTDADIVFEYKRPVVYGWYIVAAAAFGITIAAFLLATRKKKSKPPSLAERFPYNPEEYRDYDNHLPI